MKKFFLCIVAFCFVLSSQAQADERRNIKYGDLYDVEWCPCNEEEQLVDGSSVVVGQTVLCPCDSLYAGYSKGLRRHWSDAKETISQKLRAVNYFKYYIGFDWINSKPGVGSDNYSFDDIHFKEPIKVNLDDIFDDNDSLSFVLGARLHKYFGLEAFYQKTYQEVGNILQVRLRFLQLYFYYLVNSL